jgi:hypothetical protein
MTPFWKSLAFWKAVTFVIAALVLYFKPDSAVTDGALLAFALAVLHLFGVTLELRARGLK